MLGTRVIPCLLLKKGSLVKTVRFKDPKYVGDPINVVKIFNEMEVDELLFLDIAATIENRKPPFDLIAQIADECFMPFAYGGGIKTIGDMRKIFSLGAEKIVLNTLAFENPSIIKEASKIFGSQSIVVSIDIKQDDSNYQTFIRSGTISINKNAVDSAIEAEKNGAGELFLNNIDKDGTFEDYDYELIKKISKTVHIPVIVCGGAKKIENFASAKKAGASGVSAGSLFVYQNENRAVLINYPSQEELKEILG